MPDPVTLVRLWLAVRPIRKFREFRQRRKSQGVAMSDTTQIYIRGALKLVAGGLAMKAGLDAADSASLQAALEALIGGISAVVGFYLSHRKVSKA